MTNWKDARNHLPSLDFFSAFCISSETPHHEENSGDMEQLQATMKEYNQFKRKIQQRVEILEETLQELESRELLDPGGSARWREHLGRVHASLEDSLLRVAVVGSVKSGKSTLINALAGKDFLRRGAGIITSFITRVQTNDTPGGWVELKGWPQILQELNGSLRMLPVAQEVLGERTAVDIRKAKERKRLKIFLERMQAEWLQSDGRIDPHFFLLQGYLSGFECLKESLGDAPKRLMFDEHNVHLHQSYVGHQGQSVYLRDMEIHCPISWMGAQIELADCQGSDSPNPRHFALLQQYLLGCHFILYVISSRIGLREADFRLLDFIKTLRMFPQTLFVLNVDLNEHPHMDDINGMIERVRSELGWVITAPRIFAFSALYQLLSQCSHDMEGPVRGHFLLWKNIPELAEFSESGFTEFREQVEKRISGQRSRVLLGSGLSRLSMVSGSIRDSVRVQRDFMEQRLCGLNECASQFASKQKALQSTLGTLENAINGLRDSLASEMKGRIDGFFDLQDGPVVLETAETVDHFPIDPQHRRGLKDSAGALRQLYRFYLDFRQALSRYLVEKVNLRVISFSKELEELISERLESSAQAFWSLFTTAVAEYRRQMAEFQIETESLENMEEPQWGTWEKRIPPSFSAFVEEEATGRGVLLVKFGLTRIARLLAQMGSRVGRYRDLPSDGSENQSSVEDAIDLVKMETKGELLQAFARYHMEFSETYVRQILEDSIRQLLDEFHARIEMTRLDFNHLLRHGERKGEGEESEMDVLIRACRVTEAMVEELEGLRYAVNLER